MHLEEITPYDLIELKELQVTGWPSITEHFTFYLQTPFSQPYKLVNEGVMLGVGVIIFHQTSAWLASIIVRPTFRNQGLGTLITQSLLAKIDKNIYPTVSLLATELGEPVYQKLGFQKELSYNFFKNELENTFDYNSNYLISYSPIFFETIWAMDKQATGEDRSALLQAGLDTTTKMYIIDNQVLGYYIPQLFDGLIIAQDESAGLELLKFRLNERLYAGLPETNEKAVQFLQNAAFKPLAKVSRMYFGKPLDFKGEMMFNRIGGNLG